MTENQGSLIEAHSTGGLVVRSEPPPGLPYGDYRRFLRTDFVYSCAYCTMTEAEAQAVRFTIDHYEPQTARPDLAGSYLNLMYCCDECNTRKGDRSPPEIARAAGVRFFRPDNDNFEDHFELSGIRLIPKSPAGDYSIDALDLNRLSLRRLREIRARLTECDDFVSAGVLALRRYKIDQLPRDIRSNALASINKASAVAEQLASDIDTVLATYASSPLLDRDDDTDQAKDRKQRLKDREVLYPGTWRGRGRRRAQQAKNR